MRALLCERVGAMSVNRCPYCVRHVSEGGGRTDEHIFGEAFGSRATVDACHECNGSLSRTVEGDIHARDSVIDIIKWAAGEKSIRGEADLGDQGKRVDVLVDADGRPVLEHPDVRYERKGDRLEGGLSFPEGTPPEEMAAGIEKRLRREGLSEEAAKEAARKAVAGAVIVSQSIQVESTLEAKLDSLRRHSAKVALAASVAGDVPIDSEFSEALRQTLNSSDGMPEQAADSQVVERIRQKVSTAGLTPPVSSDGRPSAQVTFADVAGGTLVDVHVLGQPHPAGPVLIPVAMPELGTDGIKVVRETSQPLEVLSVSG